MHISYASLHALKLNFPLALVGAIKLDNKSTEELKSAWDAERAKWKSHEVVDALHKWAPDMFCSVLGV